jgi:hypothetical protein
MTIFLICQCIQTCRKRLINIVRALNRPTTNPKHNVGPIDLKRNDCDRCSDSHNRNKRCYQKPTSTLVQCHFFNNKNVFRPK